MNATECAVSGWRFAMQSARRAWGCSSQRHRAKHFIRCSWDGCNRPARSCSHRWFFLYLYVECIPFTSKTSSKPWRSYRALQTKTLFWFLRGIHLIMLLVCDLDHHANINMINWWIQVKSSVSLSVHVTTTVDVLTSGRVFCLSRCSGIFYVQGSSSTYSIANSRRGPARMSSQSMYTQLEGCCMVDVPWFEIRSISRRTFARCIYPLIVDWWENIQSEYAEAEQISMDE